ncbi:tetraacyldisaccharide 4'-kinase [Adhaeribacter aerolatus]|uniref:Tetraacyldisaccharide 4'-kinase n=1 Tax=Adhaeribacter aerolatus TaxID=670289 RepID=A0A512AZ31_9BACT|nr:tetraacyldisaccharide 4'-kinase [Adhaeribacter aerolatus]GEO04969.1 tetraacyldisaccharide 4'-kinase [Adhaeribacter aerolatus]
MKNSAYPLLPFSLLYAGITRARNWLYDQQVYPSHQFPVPVISVGNLTVGGTGKTPHVEFLVRLLQPRKMAILSRGYKRKTTGFVLADSSATPATIGDEPYQYTQVFPEIAVAVCEKRVAGIQKLLALNPAPEVILLDDAFQHRPVQPHLNILITDYYRLFYQDFVLPAGRLRESRSGAVRADIILVSKTPVNITQDEKENIRQRIREYARPGVPVFFTTYQYQVPVNFGLPAPLQRNLVLVTGIAQPQPLLNYLEEQGFSLLRHFNYPDHYDFGPPDIQEISNFVKTETKTPVSILTTQKDWTKLAGPELLPLVKELPFYFMPIQVQFLEEQVLFENLLFQTFVKS